MKRRRFVQTIAYLMIALLLVTGNSWGWADSTTHTFAPLISQNGFLATSANPQVGDQVEWHILVSNPSEEIGVDLIVTNSVIPELKIDVVNTSKGTYNIDGQDIEIRIPSLSPSETVRVTITTTILQNEDRIDNSSCLSAINMEGSSCVGAYIDLTPTIPTTIIQPAWWQTPAMGLVIISVFLALMGVGLAFIRRVS